MADDPLFTLKQLAEQLGLPESTVRYYRDAFLDHIPSVGLGRRRRYPAQAIAVLRTIAKHYAAGKPRAEILAAIEVGEGAHVQMPTARAEPGGLDDVSNLDLLAAILDGEREQRDALWQMAKEIVRLTEVLESQDKVLGEIADRAGVAIAGPAPAPRLTAPLHAAGPEPAAMDAPPPSPPAPAPAPSQPPQPSWSTPDPLPWSRPAAPSVEAPRPALAEPSMHEPTTPRIVPSDDLEKLKAELEAERQLVERLRTSKLQLEHRVADAEATLEERREKRPSVLRRLLGSDDVP